MSEKENPFAHKEDIANALAELRADMKRNKVEMIKWMVGTAIAIISVVIGTAIEVVKLLLNSSALYH